MNINMKKASLISQFTLHRSYYMKSLTLLTLTWAHPWGFFQAGSKDKQTFVYIIQYNHPKVKDVCHLRSGPQ